MIGSESVITSSTFSLFIPIKGIPRASSLAWLTSFAILFTNEGISKVKTRYTRLRDRINVNKLLYDKTLKESMLDKK